MIDLAIDEIEKAKHTIDSKDQELLDIKKSQKKSAREAVLGVINEISHEELEILVQKTRVNRNDR